MDLLMAEAHVEGLRRVAELGALPEESVWRIWDVAQDKVIEWHNQHKL